MKENFLKNMDSILALLADKKNVEKYHIRTRIYNINILIDYPTLYNDFVECKNSLTKLK